MNTLAPLLVAIPMGAAFAIPLAVRAHRRGGECMALVALACTLGLTLSLMVNASNQVFSLGVGGWAPSIGIEMRVDDLTSLMLMMINALALLATVYSIGYRWREAGNKHYYCLLMFVVTGLNGVALSGDLFNLYIFVEIATIASYALVAIEGKDESLESAFKYTVLGTLSSSMILVGIGLLYRATGALNLTFIADQLASSPEGLSVQAPLGLLICGLALKAGLVPFHTWLPDAYSSAPIPISALFAGISTKLIGLYVLARLLFNVYGVTDDLSTLLQWLGAATMTLGGLLALGQTDLKRMYAYSSISQVGLIVLALGFGHPLGVVGAIFHWVNHGTFKALLFLNAGRLEWSDIKRPAIGLRGGQTVFPALAPCNLVGSLSLAGMPPLCGFWSKFLIVVAAIQSNHGAWALLIVVVSIVTLVYQLRAHRKFFLADDTSIDASQTSSSSVPTRFENALMTIPVFLLTTVCFLLPICLLGGWDEPFIIGPAANVLLEGTWRR